MSTVCFREWKVVITIGIILTIFGGGEEIALEKVILSLVLL